MTSDGLRIVSDTVVKRAVIEALLTRDSWLKSAALAVVRCMTDGCLDGYLSHSCVLWKWLKIRAIVAIEY